MYTCHEPRFTVSAAPHFLLSTDDLRESIRATKRCLAEHGRVEYHDNELGMHWAFKTPEKT